MGHISGRAAAGMAAALWLAGCGGATASSPSGGGGAAATATASAETAKAATVTGHGTVLVAGSNSMTLYTFAQDTAGSGASACTGGCITRWPALTVPAGTTATSKVAGSWGTIVRGDGGGTQVTYNGSPLYFFSGDAKPGDASGNYPGWSSVTVAGAAAATPTAAGGGGVPGY